MTLSIRSPRHHSTDTTRSRSTCKAATERRRLATADALTALAGAAHAHRPTVAAETRAIAAAERLTAPEIRAQAARDVGAERRAARRARVDDAIVAQWLLEQAPRRAARTAA